MEQFCRYFGLAGMGIGTGMVLSSGLWLPALLIFVGMVFYIVYANWNRG